jgi:heavy metal efflux system protein
MILFFLEKKAITILFFFGICFLGITSWNRLNLEAYPDISDIEVSVITQVDGLPAEEVELQVTVPIERALNTVPGVISKRSRSIFGLSVVRLTFEDDTNIFLARQLIFEKLSALELSEGIKPELGPMTPSIGEIYRYVVEGDESTSITYLRELQEYIIIPKLLQADGVIDVSNFGGLIRQYQIVLNPIQLEKYKLNVKDIYEAIQNNNENTGGSFIRIGATQMNIRGVGRISRLEDIENIIVDNRNGIPILIKDIGNVELGFQPPTGILGYFDRNLNIRNDSGIEGIVLLRKFENPSKTVASIEEKVKELNESILPKNIQVYKIYDRSELVTLTIRTVITTLLEGTIVVFLILTILLGSWRAAVVSSLSIPFSLLLAFVCMDLAGIPANLLSLGAIDFGIIVDATIVMVEAIFRNFSNKNKSGEANHFELIKQSTLEVYKQILFSVFIIILALIPILSLQRVEGRLFSPMAWTLSFAIFGSMVYAVWIAPLFSFYLFKGVVISHESHFWDKVSTFYEDIVSFLLRYYKKVLLYSLIFIFGILSLSLRLGNEFLPELDEGSIWIRIFLPSGISLKEASVYPKMITQELSKAPEIRGIITQLGRNDDGTDPFGPNRIEVLIQLEQPYSKWESGKSKSEFILDVKNTLHKYLPGTNFSITQPIIDTTTENATGSSADLAIFINGKDLIQLRSMAEEILKLVKETKGASESSIEQEIPQTQLVVEVNRAACARYGVSVQDINLILRTAIGGIPVSNLFEQERQFDIVIRFTEESRNTPEKLGKILIPTKSEKKIPLSLVANIRLEDGESIIFREDEKRQIIVKTNIRGRDQGGFATEIQKKINDKIKEQSGVTIYLGGQFENMQRSQERLLYIVPLTLVLIYITLYFYFKNNYIQALVVIMNVPIAVAGGILALWVRSMNFNISAGVGFVSLFGISVMSGVLLISYLNSIKTEESDLKEIVLTGSVIQFKPRLLVMSIAIIGLLPAAINSGVGSDIQRPLATVIVGGLSFSLIIGIFLLPIIYYYFQQIDRK